MSDARRRIQTDPRMRSRRQAVERRRRNRVLGWLLAIALLGFLVWVAFFSPLLDVHRVKLVGSKHTSNEEVLEATGIEGDNLLLISTGSLEEDIRALPWVATAKIDRILPDTVRVTIRERRAAFVIEGLQGTWTVDASGHVLQKGRAGRLPVLQAAVTGTLVPGEQVDDDGARAVLRMWRSLPPRLRSDVVAIFAPSAERISFSLSNRTLIRYGSAHMVGAKRRVLVALLGRLRKQGRTAAYIDVRVPSNPAVAPAATPGPSATPNPSPSPTPGA